MGFQPNKPQVKPGQNELNDLPSLKRGGSIGEASVSKQSKFSRRFLLGNTLIVMLATVGSRVLGLLREVVIAATYGTSGNYNAYVAAFRIPDLLYLLIIGGALGSALIPVFSRFLGQGDQATAWRLANAVINLSLITIIIAGLLTFILAPFLVPTLIAPGFKDPAEIELTVNLTRVLLLQPILLGLGGIGMALLNGTDHFLWPALAPLFYNASIILGTLFLSSRFDVYGIVIGVLAGAVIYLLVQLPPLFRLGLKYKPGLDLNAPGLRDMLRVLGPRLLGQAAFQLNFFVITNLASRIKDASSISSLNYAFQLFMLPHGIFALSVATVAFPAMSRLLGAGDINGLKETFTRSLKQIVFFAFPATLGLALLARPVVGMLFQLGKFNKSSTEQVSSVLVFFSFGLLAYGVVEIVTRAFYALQDTRTPVIIAVLTVGLNIFLSLILGREETMGGPGLAFSLAIATTVEMGCLLWLLYRKIGEYTTAKVKLLLPVVKIALASDIMAAVLWVSLNFLSPSLEEATKIGLIILTLGLIGLGAAVYGLVSLALGVDELKGAVRRFSRR